MLWPLESSGALIAPPSSVGPVKPGIVSGGEFLLYAMDMWLVNRGYDEEKH